MSESETQAAKAEAPAPSRGIRLAWWFGIAAWPVLPSLFAGPLAFAYPIGLLGLFRGLLTWHYPGDNSGVLLPLALAYGLYLVHLIATLAVRTRLSFNILRGILVGMMVLNISGCAAIWHGLSEIH